MKAADDYTVKELYAEINKIVPKETEQSLFFTKEDTIKTLLYLGINKYEIEGVDEKGVKFRDFFQYFIPEWVSQTTVGNHPTKTNLIILLAHLDVAKLKKARKIKRGTLPKQKDTGAQEEKTFQLSVFNFLQQANLPFERYIKSISLDKEEKSITLTFK